MNPLPLKYSLVVATLGRKAELVLLLESLAAQTMPAGSFEVIIVDQNEPGVIDDIVAAYASKLQLRHIRSARKGLSYNRNLGIAVARGHYIAVPDDDCTYYPDTLQQLADSLERHDMPDMLIGKVFDREQQRHVFKKTPGKALKVSERNFYPLVSSITMFFRNNELRFDESFGVGAAYASNEDGVLILSFLHAGKTVWYTPSVDCDHPPYDASTMPLTKLYLYGIGFGAMCRKFWSAALCWLFIKVICFQLLMGLRDILCLRYGAARRRWYALKGRCSGFFSYAAGNQE